MNIFLELGRIIKFLVVGSILMVLTIATVFLLVAMMPNNSDAHEPITLPISDDKMKATAVGVPPSALLNSIVLLNNSYSMQSVALTLSRGKVYKFEVWGMADRNISQSYNQSYNKANGKGVYAYGWYDMRGKLQITAYCSIKTILADNNSYYDYEENDYSDYKVNDNVATFISIGGYDMNYAVIAAGGSSIESTVDIQSADYYIGGVIDLDDNNPAGAVVGDNSIVNGKIVITEYDVAPAYRVTFDMNGRGEPIPANQSILQGETVEQPDNPACIGWTFDGWFNDQDCTAQWNFDTDTVYATTTLYAKWTVNTYTEPYNSN